MEKSSGKDDGSGGNSAGLAREELPDGEPSTELGFKYGFKACGNCNLKLPLDEETCPDCGQALHLHSSVARLLEQFSRVMAPELQMAVVAASSAMSSEAAEEFVATTFNIIATKIEEDPLEYNVAIVRGKEGLGLKLGVQKNSRVVVLSFKESCVGISPAQKNRLICPGHELLSVNGKRIVGAAFEQVVTVLGKAESPLFLRLRRLP